MPRREVFCEQDAIKFEQASFFEKLKDEKLYIKPNASEYPKQFLRFFSEISSLFFEASKNKLSGLIIESDTPRNTACITNDKNFLRNLAEMTHLKHLHLINCFIPDEKIDYSAFVFTKSLKSCTLSK